MMPAVTPQMKRSLVGHGVVEALPLLPHAALATWFSAVIRKPSGTSKAASTSCSLMTRSKRRRDDAEHRRDAVARTGDVVGHAADHLDGGRRQADLLERLAQRSLLGGSVGRIDAPAGKGDLAGMAAQLLGALGEKHGRLRAAVDHRDQHRRVAQAVAHDEVGEARVEAMVAIVGAVRSGPASRAARMRKSAAENGLRGDLVHQALSRSSSAAGMIG